MASKRVATTALDWSVLGSKIHATQKNSFVALKVKVDKHMRTVNSLPESLPAIDFSLYKNKVAVPGMVETFEKSYAGLQIPYPTDQGKIAEIDAQAVESKSNFNKFVDESNTRISGFKVELSKWEAMKPVEEMNLEEALDQGLPFVVDPSKPTGWPHTETWDDFNARVAKSTPADWH